MTETSQQAGEERQAVAGPVGTAPLRRPRSNRRTTSVDMTWPAGYGGGLRLDGRARDAVTVDPASAPTVVAVASTSVGIGEGRVIENIVATPSPAGLQRLVGCRGGGYLRAALDEHIPDERAAGSLLALLLDDVSGCSLIAGFGWSRWVREWVTPPDRTPRPSMEGVCIGFAPGSRALVEMGEGMRTDRTRPVGPLVNPDDSDGWHELAELPDISMRRARRIDVWREGDEVKIDAGFQDSAGDPTHQRVAVHEYVLTASADEATLTLRSVDADPRILPFLECPAAVVGARSMVGTPLAELRSAVLNQLAKTNGCTHLNDALRALADVPAMLAQLDALGPWVSIAV